MFLNSPKPGPASIVQPVVTRRYAVLLTLLLAGGPVVVAQRARADVPDDFPRFVVPGHQAQMASLRELFWEHYSRRKGPASTLWDEWLSGSTLWPAAEDGNLTHDMRADWRAALSSRFIDNEGYVATHQHGSIAHQHGWPFPFWAAGGDGAWGWHFSLQAVPPGWHGTQEKTQQGWTVENGTDAGIENNAWNIRLSAPHTSVGAPPLNIDVLQAPFVQLRWRATGLGNAQPYLEWTTADEPEFTPRRRMHFTAIESNKIVYTMIPVYRQPEWTGRINALRIGFGNPGPGGTVGIQALFTQYDTRHNVNNQNFIMGCIQYFLWTQDFTFLREQIQRMRLALRYLMTECHGREQNCIVTPFVGHCGRSGLHRDADGNKTSLPGRGIGNNYWDLLPFGRRDAYATMLYYAALRRMAELERLITDHPEWSIPGGPLRCDPDSLDRHADDVKANNHAFWNTETKRFTLGPDDDGKCWDFGFTFMNLEAIYYNFATAEQTDAIMSWIAGDRIVEGDTSQGTDIYHWRFGPRSTTKRNVEYYGWYWPNPESIPWGGQVQDGGAVLGFAYHDLMARLKTRGPDDAWTRLREIIAWYDEVQKAGGPREYYKDATRGSLQGCGKPGGLGIDCEFRESILVPQVVIRGFLGFKLTATGFSINPALPSTWSELTVNRIHLHDLVLTVGATRSAITVTREGAASEPFHIELPPGSWTLHYLDRNGDVLREMNVPARDGPDTVEVDWQNASTIRFDKKRPSPEGAPLTRPTAARPLATPVAGLRPFVEDTGWRRARVNRNLSRCIWRERNSER